MKWTEILKKWIPLLVAIAVLVHHNYIHGYWLDFSDIASHETIVVFFLGIWIRGLFQGKYQEEF